MTVLGWPIKDWSPADTDTLIKGWRAGETSVVLSKKLKRSRSAILGRVHRLKQIGVLEGRMTTPPPVQHAPEPPKPIPEPVAEPTVVAVVTEEPKPVKAAGLTLADLNPKIHCRWPLDAPGGGYIYCGKQPEYGKSYCLDHVKLARPK